MHMPIRSPGWSFDWSAMRTDEHMAGYTANCMAFHMSEWMAMHTGVCMCEYTCRNVKVWMGAWVIFWTAEWVPG